MLRVLLQVTFNRMLTREFSCESDLVLSMVKKYELESCCSFL